MLHIKDGVDLSLLKPVMIDALITMSITMHIFEYVLVITAGNDGNHKVGSLHYKGYAVDLRSRDLTPERIERISDALRAALGPKFDVVFEVINGVQHWHVEYDPNHDGGKGLP